MGRRPGVALPGRLGHVAALSSGFRVGEGGTLASGPREDARRCRAERQPESGRREAPLLGQAALFGPLRAASSGWGSGGHRSWRTGLRPPHPAATPGQDGQESVFPSESLQGHGGHGFTDPGLTGSPRRRALTTQEAPERGPSAAGFRGCAAWPRSASRRNGGLWAGGGCIVSGRPP